MTTLTDFLLRCDQYVTTLKDLLQRCDHLDRVVAKVGPILDRFLAEIRQSPHTVRSQRYFCVVLRHGLILHSDMQYVCVNSLLQCMYVYSVLQYV